MYLCPNIECIDAQDQKYKNLQDVVETCKALGGITLLIKPHPRYRNEEMLIRIMKMNNFKDYRILEDDPLICYQDYIDFVINFGTSAVNDILPNGFKKVIIYDTFFPDKGIKNIYSDDFNYITWNQDLKDFLSGNLPLHNKQPDVEKLGQIRRFFLKWVAASSDPEKIARNIAGDMQKDLLAIKNTKRDNYA